MALDITQPQSVKYCVPLWLRDEQIRVNLAAVPGRLQAQDVVRTEPIAIACYGPSLNDTWEALRGYRFIVTCSGAHRFLIDRGIVPTWHIDVDPRPHKLALIGEPHADVEYLIASTCHPSYFQTLLDGGFTVKLWHIFDGQADAMRTLPPSEWALFGGSDAGHRAMVMARFLGFTDLHVYGMDGCEGASGKHAAAHPSQPKGADEVIYEGVTYRTTPAMLECVRQLRHEVDQLGDCRVTFYGDGLAQAYMRGYVANIEGLKGQPSVGVVKPRLISAEYAALNAQLHRENLAYGVGGARHASEVQKIVESLTKTQQRVIAVLDYGCGKGYLAKALPFPIYEYDPAIPGKQESPRAADVVACTDVLEHIEPDKLDVVLQDLSRCVLQVGYFVIDTGPARKTLPDGRNTHLIQQPPEWWRETLSKYFTIGTVISRPPQAHVIVGPKKKAKAA